jgi:hypothetical protein
VLKSKEQIAMPTPAIKEVSDIIDERKAKLQGKFETDSGQGILPFTNEKYFEQSNPIVRSALFSTVKIGKVYTDWTNIFSFGGGNIMYKGPALTVEHEIVMARLLVLARGRSLTKPVAVFLSDVRKWLELDDSGINFNKARKILEDLGSGEIKIADKIALKRLHHILISPNLGDRPDGKFFKESIDHRFGPMIKMIGEGLEKDEPVDITMRLIANQATNGKTGRMLLSLDYIAAVFFDGVNTTLLPFEIWDTLDRFGKKLLPFIASHRAGVFAIKLESYHKFSGSISDFAVVKRRFKSEMKKRLENWEKLDYIEPGWSFYKNEEGEELLKGLKLSSNIRIKSELTVSVVETSEGTYWDPQAGSNANTDTVGDADQNRQMSMDDGGA